MRRLGAVLAVAVLVTGLWLTVVAPVTHAVESEGIGALPANPRADNPRSKSIFVYTLSPGEQVNDGVKVINNTASTKTVLVYAVDSVSSSDGAFACAQAVDQKKSVGSWITLQQSEVTLKPFASEVVPFTLSIPEKADAGEHDGCVVLQDATAKNTASKGLTLTFRSALRVAVTVPGTLVERLRLDSVSQQLSHDGKTYIVTPAYTNNGNVSLDTNISVHFRTIFGQTAGGEAHGQFPTLPKTSSRFNFELAKPFWGGLYKREVMTTYHSLATGGKNGDKSLPTHSTWLFLEPAPAAIAIELATLAVALAAATWYVQRQRQHAALLVATKKYTVKAGDNIQALADHYGINWKRLAKLNNLKAPYALTPGDSIKVPRAKAMQSRAEQEEAA